MKLCRGPLPAGHPLPGVTYFSPDHDVAENACNLRATPPVEALRRVDGPCVLLDAHRAPDEWFVLADMMPNLLVQGDPRALRPQSCSRFADELAKQPWSQNLPMPQPHVRCVARLRDAWEHAEGKTVVLAANRSTAGTVYQSLRPDGLLAGDLVHDYYGRSYRVNDATSSNTHIFVDGGRLAKKKECLQQHVVVSPGSVRCGEYDTVIVMPGVSPTLGRAVCFRCRFMVVAVAHSPYGYLASYTSA